MCCFYYSDEGDQGWATFMTKRATIVLSLQQIGYERSYKMILNKNNNKKVKIGATFGPQATLWA